MIITIAALKGGCGKTTTTAHLAAAAHRDGAAVRVIDTDPQGSALSWGESAAAPWPTVAQATATVHRRIEQLVKDGEIVLIDTPNDPDQKIVTSALMAGQFVVMPVKPALVDIERVPHGLRVIEDVTMRTGAELMVLLTMATRNTNAARDARAALEDAGLRVARTEIHNLQDIGRSFGRSEPHAEYVELWQEIKEALR